MFSVTLNTLNLTISRHCQASVLFACRIETITKILYLISFLITCFLELPIITNVDGLLSHTIVNNNIGFVYRSDDDLRSLLRSDEISSAPGLSVLKASVKKCGETVFCENVNNNNLISFVHKTLQ